MSFSSCENRREKLRLALTGDFYCPLVWGDVGKSCQSALISKGIEKKSQDNRSLFISLLEAENFTVKGTCNENGINGNEVEKTTEIDEKSDNVQPTISNLKEMKDSSTGMSQPIFVDIGVGSQEVNFVECGTGNSQPLMMDCAMQTSQEVEKPTKASKRKQETGVSNPPVISPRLPLQTRAPEVLPKLRKLDYFEDRGKCHPIYSNVMSNHVPCEFDFDEANKENSFMLDRMYSPKGSSIYAETGPTTEKVGNGNYLPNWGIHCVSRNPFVRVGLSKKSLARKPNPLHPSQLRTHPSDCEAKEEFLK